MTTAIIDAIRTNGGPLGLAQLRAIVPGDIGPALGALMQDGAIRLVDLGGVDGYTLGDPPAPKPKAAPTSRMVPIALLDALALAVNVPIGTPIVDMCHAIEAERAIGIANHRALQNRSDPSAAPTLPDGWSAVYTCDGAEVRPTTRGRWEWAVGVEGEDGSGVCADLSIALAKADAVRALS